MQKRKLSTPEEDCIFWVEAGLDKEGFTVKYISDYKGRQSIVYIFIVVICITVYVSVQFKWKKTFHLIHIFNHFLYFYNYMCRLWSIFYHQTHEGWLFATVCWRTNICRWSKIERKETDWQHVVLFFLQRKTTMVFMIFFYFMQYI